MNDEARNQKPEGPNPDMKRVRFIAMSLEEERLLNEAAVAMGSRQGWRGLLRDLIRKRRREIKAGPGVRMPGPGME